MITIVTNLEALKMKKEIIIHCSATPNGRPHTAEDIHRWHTERGWSGIGYHKVIRTSGIVDDGRPEYWQGAHAKGHNKNSIGICLIGTDEFSSAQWSSLKALIECYKEVYPGCKIIGHNEVSDKKCPGFDVQEWLKREQI
jgi:hypothetical protein